MRLQAGARGSRDEDPQRDMDSGYGSGSHRVGSGNMGSLLESSAVWASLSAEQKALVEDRMSRMALEHSQNLQYLHETLENTQARVMQQRADNSALRSKVTELAASLAASDESKVELDAARARRAEIEQQRGDLIDNMRGRDAVHKAQIGRLEQNLADLKATQVHANEQASEAAEERRREVGELLSEIQAAQEDYQAMQDKVDEMESATAAETDINLARLTDAQALLDASRHELARYDNKDLGMDSSMEVEGDDVSRHRVLEDLLSAQNDDNAVLSDRLTTKRLELLNLQQEHKKKMDKFESMLQGFEPPQGVAPPALGQAGRKKKRDRASNALPTIDEGLDPDEVGSVATSGITCGISSEGLSPYDGVATLADFDDLSTAARASGSSFSDPQESNRLLAQLRCELKEVESATRQLSDSKIFEDARMNSKVARLLEQLNAAQSERVSQESALEVVAITKYTSVDEQKKDIESLERDLQNLIRDKDVDDQVAEQRLRNEDHVHATVLEKVQQRLALADEQKRLLSMRLADTRRELQHQKERNDTLDTMYEAKLNDRMGAPNSAAQIQVVEQERNVLVNKLEAQTVHYEAQLEYAHMRLSQERMELEMAKAQLKKDLEFEKDLQAKIANTAKLLNKRKAERAAVAEREQIDQDTTATGDDAPAGASTSFLSLLRCPSRSSQEGNSDQRCLWQLITGMERKVAVLCRGLKLEISDATKEACSIWGRSALFGSSVTSLFANQELTSWFLNKVRRLPHEAGCHLMGLLPAFAPMHHSRRQEYAVLCSRGGLAEEEFIFIFQSETSDTPDAPPMASAVINDVHAPESGGGSSRALDPM